MPSVPEAVKAAFDRAKSQYPFYVALARINGKYYVYRHYTIWDRERKKAKSASEYLGRISDNGVFIKKKLSATEDLENAKALIVAHGGEIKWREEEQPQPISKPKPPQSADDIDIRIIKELSTDARASHAAMGKRLGLSKSAIYGRIRRLEETYGIRYTMEPYLARLGFSTYCAMVHFEGEKPDYKMVAELLDRQPETRLVLETTGSYELMIYFMCEDNVAADEFIHTMKARTALGKYTSRWYVTPSTIVYGFIPLRERFFELLGKKAWKRTRESPRPMKNQLTQRECTILSELCRDSSADFTAIAKRCGLTREEVAYTYERLMAKKVVSRPTITMGGLNVRYNAMLLMEINNGQRFIETWKSYLLDISRDDFSIINKYCFVSDTGNPYGQILALPVLNPKDLDEKTEELKRNVKGIEIRTMIATNVLVGEMGYRNLPRRHSAQYRGLMEHFGFKEEPS